MVEIYTDASVGKGTAVTTCFVLTDRNFIGYTTKEFQNIATSVHGEILGAVSAIEYAASVIDLTGDKVTLLCDSIATLNLLKRDLDSTTYKQAKMYEKDLRTLQTLLSKYNVNIQLIRGHQMLRNPNVIVDVMSNSHLRNVRRSE